MTPNEVIDAYVREVVRRLPRKQRNDVGFELRELLGEMLADRAGGNAEAAPVEATVEMLREFGAPADVTERYNPAGPVIIPAGQTRSFTMLALAGVALQWAITFPRALAGEPLASWWLRWGIEAFWWPGLIVTIALASAWLGRISPEQAGWTPRGLDRERIDRRLWIAGIIFFVLAALTLASLPWLANGLAEPARHVFAFDPGFLRNRAPAVLVLWLGQLMLLLSVVVKGRWSRLSRRFNLGLSIAFALLLSWWLAAGKIFQAPQTDNTARGCVVLTIALIASALVQRLTHWRSRIRSPQAISGSAA